METKSSIVGRIADMTRINNHFRRIRAPKNIDDDDEIIISPVQGRIAAIGKIDSSGTLISKHRKRTKLSAVLGKHSRIFRDSCYINIYLNPIDKHFWVAPYEGKFIHTYKSEATTRLPVLIGLENLYSRLPLLRRINVFEKAARKNASIGSVLKTKEFSLAMIAVGSLNVNRICTLYNEKEHCTRGIPCGYFTIGSSMLLCFPDSFDILVKKGEKVRIGQKILKIGRKAKR